MQASLGVGWGRGKGPKPTDDRVACGVGLGVDPRESATIVQIIGSELANSCHVPSLGCVSCWLGPPCKVKSDRFAVSLG